MATAFTGSLGWASGGGGTAGGPHPFQPGGPPLIQSYARALPTAAHELLAHAYANDGVTPLSTNATFSILNRPKISAQTTNGGFDQITLEVAAPVSGLALGNVVRLTEQGGTYNGFVYSGIVESFPDTRSPGSVTHQILLTPFGWELLRVPSTFVYNAPTDALQAARDAISLCQHCSCDTISVPASSGVLIAQASGVDFRGQKLNQVLNTIVTLLGPTWYWFCDELGRVWIQASGSQAQYTLMGGQHYQSRTTNGGDISHRINQVQAVGGVPVGGAGNVTAIVNGSSQSSIGVRTLDPALQVPGVSDQATLSLIANGVLAILDVTWTRFQIEALPNLGSRVHQSQPGGAMVRYFEESVNPLQESAVGSGGYVGPYIATQLAYDGATQMIQAASAPVASQADISNLLQSIVSRVAVNALQVTAAALNLNQTLTGSFQSGTGTVTPTGLRATLWSLGQQEFESIDPNGIPRAEQGNLPANGISPAQWGFRASDANGTPIFDSLGLIGVMKELGHTDNTTGYTNSTTSFTVISGSAVTFSLTRALRVLAQASCFGSAASQTGVVNFFVDGVDQNAIWPAMAWGGGAGGSTATIYLSILLAAGSHTVDLRGAMTAIPGTLSLQLYDLIVWQLGS